MIKDSTLEIGGVSVAVSRLDKIFYPKTGFTKGDVIDYYIRISPFLLPHLKGRPVSLKRYPNGVEGFFFYEKNCPDYRPKWMKTIEVAKSDGGKIQYCAMDDLPALVWAVNLADLELHTFLHRYPAMHRPTCLAFDLDPGPPAGILQCAQVALLLREIFQGLEMEVFAKTSGSKGMQVYVPLNTPTTYEKTKKVAETIAKALAERFPDRITGLMNKAKRAGKVFVDWSQNDEKKTTVCVYSLRAKDHPTVSAPVTWSEVEASVKRQRPLGFEAGDILSRVEKRGDLFAPVLSLKQKLPPLTRVRACLEQLSPG
ncbi:MAG: ATP-dependent DNA ligase [Cupriavidus sp.]|nr:MAG: ATP-dependent DNA ligase [Cupriavidus sp.]